ncbi:MAG: lipid kinase, partial [Defluviitaleaceae bacterium]|nr:lipid kinase [Defluviitaleaceae bacterium]
ADVAAACKTLAARNIVCADIGTVNGQHHFVNVCAAGMLTNISHYIDQDLKNSLGKLAYYIKGLEQIPNFVPLRFKITTAAEVFEEELYFFFILNSSGAGGFDKLSPGAKLDDGLFDFVGFRAFPIFELPALFLKVLAGDCLDDRRILFVRDSFFRVEYLSPPGDKMMMITDIDGEPGPQFPIEVHNMARHLPILTT